MSAIILPTSVIHSVCATVYLSCYMYLKTPSKFKIQQVLALLLKQDANL